VVALWVLAFFLEKIPYMPQLNVAHVLYAIENAKLSPMLKVVMLLVLYAISVRCSRMPLVGR
jgi:hypothetical protein